MKPFGMDFSKKAKITVGATVGLVILVIIIFIAATGITFQAQPCGLQNNRPKYDGNKSRKVTTDDNRNLLIMNAYLEYSSNGPAKFLPLEVKSMDVFKLIRTHQQSTVMNVTTDCAVVEFSFNHDNYGSFVSSSIKLILNDVPDGVLKVYTTNPSIYFNEYMHYSCDKEKRYACRDVTVGGTQVGLVVDYLEFELYGDPSSISIGDFSTKQTYCS